MISSTPSRRRARLCRQNFGAGEIKRCKKTLLLCLLEGIISLGVAIALILFFGKSLLTIFNGDPQVVETGIFASC